MPDTRTAQEILHAIWRAERAEQPEIPLEGGVPITSLRELEAHHRTLAQLQHERAQEILANPDEEQRKWRWNNRLRSCEGRDELTLDEYREGKR